MGGPSNFDYRSHSLAPYPGTAHRRRKPGQDASRFKTDEDTGKMIIDEDDGPEDEDVSPSAHIAGSAYRETVTSVDGFTRGLNGKVKFNKDTKKRRREAAASEDVEMADQEMTVEAKKPKRRAELKLGHEFKAKVSCTGILGFYNTQAFVLV